MSRKRVPMAMPAGAVGERRHQAAAVEEAAGGDHRDVHRVDHLRQQHRGGHAARVPAGLAALHDHRVGAPARHLLGVAARADRRDARPDPRPSAASSASRDGARAKDATFTPSRTISVGALHHVGGVGAQVHAEGSVGAVLRARRSRRPARAGPSVAEAMMPRPPALAVAATSPALGDPAHAGLHDRVTRRRPSRQSAVSGRGGSRIAVLSRDPGGPRRADRQAAPRLARQRGAAPRSRRPGRAAAREHSLP